MKNPFRKMTILTALTAVALSTSSMANPSGPTIKAGQVNISGGSPTLNIEQLTNKAIIDWDRFSIGASEAVRFLQPSQMAVILNRVTGQDPSQILGSLSANGQVFLINPNGIVFGANSTIDVGGLVASTLGISDEDFLAGKYNFQQDPRKELASIINQGTIRVSEGGYAILTAPLVSNEGLIVANLGKVALAGGESTTVNFDGRELINFEVAGLQAEAGTVVLPPEAVGGLLSDTLGAAGRADSLVERADGTLALERGSGTVVQAGVVRADGAEGSKAGEVRIDSTHLTVLGAGSVTAADGQGANSEGGEVYALSNLDSGTILGLSGSLLSARGGDTGDGGFIEFSGHQFHLASSVDARAPGGFAGVFLLDPRDITIISGADAGNPFPLPAAPADSTITDGTLEAIAPTTSLITLQADRDIIFNNTGDNTLDLSALVDPDGAGEGLGHLVLQAGGDVIFNDDIIIAPAIDILAGLNAAGVGRNGDVTGGTLRANDIDIGVATTNALTVGTSAAPDVAGRTAQAVTGLVNIGFDRLTAAGGTSTSLTEADANTVQQDLTVLANGNITLTDNTAALAGTGLNTQDQIRIERFDREARAITAGAPTSNDSGIRSTNGNVTLTTTRYVAVGKGASDAIDSGDNGTNILAADATGSVLTVTAGALQDRSGGLEDITARDGHAALTTTRGDLGGDLASGAALDVVAEALTGRGAIDAAGGANVGFDISGDAGASAQFIDLLVRDSQLEVRDNFGALGAGAPTMTIDNATNLLTGNGQAFGATDMRVAHSGQLNLGGDLVVGANSTLILESSFFNHSGPGALSGRIHDGNAGTNNVTLGAGSTLGFSAGGDVGQVTDHLELIAPTANGQEATLAVESRGDGSFIEVTGDIIVGTATIVNRAITPNNQASQVVGIFEGQDNRLVATGDIRVTSAINTGIEGGFMDLISQTGRIDIEANITVPERLVIGAATGISQVQGNLITVPLLGVFTTNGDAGSAANPIDFNAVGFSVDVNRGADATAGDGYFNDTAGGLTIADTVTGVVNTVSAAGVPNNADGDLSITAQSGDLNLNADVTAGEDLELAAQGGLFQELNLAAGVDLVAGDGTDDQGDGENAVLSSTGEINQVDGGTVTVRGTLGLFTGNGDVGSPADTFDFNASGLALDLNGDPLQGFNNGSGFLLDPDGVTLVDSVTGVLLSVANGVPNNVDRDLALTTSEGNIALNGDINIGRNADIIALDTNNSDDDGDISIGSTATVTTTGNLTLSAARNITQTDGDLVAAAQLGLVTGDGNVGTSTDDFDYNAPVIAFRPGDSNGDGTGGSVYLDRSGGGVTILPVTTSVMSIVTSVTTPDTIPGDLAVEASGGDLDINKETLTVGGDLQLIARDREGVGAGGRVLLGSTIGGGATPDITVGNPGAPTAAENNAVFSAVGDILQFQGGTLNVEDGIAFETVDGNVTDVVGSAAADTFLSFNAVSLALDVNDGNNDETGGDVFLLDTDGGIALVDTLTAVNEPVSAAGTPNNVDNDLVLRSTEGNIQINAALNVGEDLELRANDTNGSGDDGDIQFAAVAVNVGTPAAPTAANNDAVLRAARNITQTNGGLVTVEDTLGLATGGDVGSQANDFDINATSVVLGVPGSAFIDDSAGGLQTAATVTTVTETVNAVASVANLFLESSGGDLQITNPQMITTDGVLVAIDTDGAGTGGRLVLGNEGGNTASNVTAGDDLILGATGDIVNVLTSSVSSGAGLGIQTVDGNVASQANPLPFTAGTVLTLDVRDGNGDETGGDAFLASTSVTVGSNVSSLGRTVNAGGTNTVDNDLSLTSTAANLTLNSDLTVGEDADLVTTGANTDIALGANVDLNVTGNAALVSTRTITQDNSGTLTAGNLGLRTGATVGSGADPLDFNSTGLALDITGSAFLNETDGVSIIDSVTGVAQTVSPVATPNSVTQQLSLTTGEGTLGINADLNVGAEADFIANDTNGSGDDGDIALGAGVDLNVTNNATMRAARNITQVNGGTFSAARVGLQTTDGDVGVAGGDAFDVTTAELALNIGNANNDGVGGSANVTDSDGGITVVDTVMGVATTVTGNTIARTLQLTANDADANNDGAITVADQISIGTNADLSAEDDININANVVSQDGVNGSVVLRADNDNDENGGLTQGGGTVTAVSLGLAAGENIGTPGGAAFTAEVTNLAVSTDSDNDNAGGGINVTDSDGGVNIAATVTGVVDSVSGARSAGSMQITAADTDGNNDGNLTVTGTVTAVDGNIDLTAENNLTLNNNVAAQTAGRSAVLTADSDGDMMGDVSQSAGSSVTATNLGLSGRNVRGTGAADPLDFDSTNLTINVTGDGNVRDSAGGVTLVNTVTGVVRTVTNNRATNLQVEAQGGDLTVNAAGGVTTTQDLDLVSSNNVSLTQGAINSVNAVLSAGQAITQTGGTVTTTSLGLNAGADIGSAGTPFSVNTGSLSVNVPGNDGFITDTAGGVALVDSVTGVTRTVNGNNADNLRVVAQGGDLTVNAGTNGVMATSDVDLVSTTGNVNLTAGTVSGQNVVLSANQAITRTTGTVTSTNLGLNAGADLGTAANLFTVNTGGLALNIPGNDGFITDTAGGVTLIDSVTGVTETVNGNNTDDLRVVAQGGDLTVNAGANGVTATSDLDLVSTTGNVNLTAGAVSGQNVVLSAGQAIARTTGTVAATNLGLNAGADIGSAANPLSVNTGGLSVNVPGNDAFITDTAAGVTLLDSVTGVTQIVNGNNADNLRVVAQGGDLTVNAGANGVMATNDIDLVSTTGNVNLTAGAVSGQNVVLSANQAITRTTGTVTSTNLGLSAGAGLGTEANPFTVNTGGLALNIPGNDGFITDTAGGVTLVDSVTGVTETVNGNNADDLRVVAQGGDLTVNAGANGVTATSDLDLVSTTGNVNLTAGPITGTNMVFSAGQSITQGTSSVTGTSLGLNAGADIGGGAGDPLDVSVTNAVIRSGGTSRVRDLDGGVTLVNSVTGVTETVTGNQTGGGLRVEAADANNNGDGTLTVASGLTIGGGGDLVAENDLILNATVNATGNLVLQSDSDGDGGQLTQLAGQTVNAAGLGLNAPAGIGTGGDAFDINATNLTFRSPNAGANVNIRDGAGGLTLVNSVTGLDSTVTGNTANNNIQVEAFNGALTINAAVTSVVGSMDLVADGNNGGTCSVILNNVVTAAAGNVVIVAMVDITDPNDTGRIVTNQVGLQAGNDAGAQAAPLDVTATNLSFNTGRDLFVEDTAGGINVVNSVTGVARTVNGPTAGRDGRVVANNGDLNLNAATTIGRDGELVTKGSGDVLLDQTYDARNGNVVIRTAGSILNPNGNGIVQASGLGLDAGSGIVGTAAQPIRMETGTLTRAQTTGTFVADPTGFTQIRQITAIQETVIQPFPIVPPPGVTFTSDPIFGENFAQNNTWLIEDLIEEGGPDNDDNVLNEVAQEVVDDDEFGVTKR